MRAIATVTAIDYEQVALRTAANEHLTQLRFTTSFQGPRSTRFYL